MRTTNRLTLYQGVAEISNGRHDSSPKVKPKHLDRPLVAGCSIGHKSRPLHVSRLDMGQTKKSKYMLNIFFPKMVSVILGSSYHADACSTFYFSDKFRFTLRYILRWGDVMVDSRDWLYGRDVRKWRCVVHIYIQSMVPRGVPIVSLPDQVVLLCVGVSFWSCCPSDHMQTITCPIKPVRIPMLASVSLFALFSRQQRFCPALASTSASWHDLLDFFDLGQPTVFDSALSTVCFIVFKTL